jgi:hypothetical protein
VVVAVLAAANSASLQVDGGIVVYIVNYIQHCVTFSNCASLTAVQRSRRLTRYLMKYL